MSDLLLTTRTRTVDEKCHRLAVDFLMDHFEDAIPKEYVDELAYAIQSTIEFYIEGMEAKIHPPERGK